MNHYIELMIGGLAVKFTRFLDDAFPRQRAETEPSKRSAYGSFVGFGKVYEAPHVWAFSAIISSEEADILKAIWQEHDALRRAFFLNPINDAPASIRVVDTTERFVEKHPRTRAMAPNTTARDVPGGYTSYYAQFYAWFARPPEFRVTGHRITTTIALEEVNEKVQGGVITTPSGGIHVNGDAYFSGKIYAQNRNILAEIDALQEQVDALPTQTEGTWTPRITKIADSTFDLDYQWRVGRWSKIGTICHFTADLQTNPITFGYAALMLTGLPFARRETSGTTAGGGTLGRSNLAIKTWKPACYLSENGGNYFVFMNGVEFLDLSLLPPEGLLLQMSGWYLTEEMGYKPRASSTAF
jgi:hypothetical protein